MFVSTLSNNILNGQFFFFGSLSRDGICACSVELNQVLVCLKSLQFMPSKTYEFIFIIIAKLFSLDVAIKPRILQRVLSDLSRTFA